MVLRVNCKNGTKEEPIAWLLVERTEIYKKSPDGEVTSAYIAINYQQILIHPTNAIMRRGGEFYGGYSKYNNMVSITSKTIQSGFVTLDLPGLEGQRIGTYLMNEIVQWVKQWPEAIVNTIRLDIGQATALNKVRRNKFYEQFGIKFDYDNINNETGKSRPIKAKELKSTTSWQDNITEIPLLDYLNEVLSLNQDTQRELKFRNEAFKRLLISLRKAEEQPILWALKRLIFN